MRTPARTASAAACALLVAAPACAPSPGPADPLRVYAAASLQPAFAELGRAYTAAGGPPVAFTFAGSADLVTQLAHGAPGDVLATADEATLARARDERLLRGDASVFATNTLVVAVAPGNPRRITAYADLAAPGLALVRCAAQVPCGAAARAVERAARVTTHPVSEENSVTDVLGKVTSGQADAGLVYATDVLRAQGRAEAVRFPEASAAVNRYPVAPLAGAAHREAADAFIAFVRGPQGQQVLARAGFGAP